MKRMLGTLIGVAVAGVAHSGKVPFLKPEMVDPAVAFILGALHISKPGDKA